jgi:hypothetical protein
LDCSGRPSAAGPAHALLAFASGEQRHCEIPKKDRGNNNQEYKKQHSQARLDPAVGNQPRAEAQRRDYSGDDRLAYPTDRTAQVLSFVVVRLTIPNEPRASEA